MKIKQEQSNSVEDGFLAKLGKVFRTMQFLVGLVLLGVGVFMALEYVLPVENTELKYLVGAMASTTVIVSGFHWLTLGFVRIFGSKSANGPKLGRHSRRLRVIRLTNQVDSD